MKKKKSVMTGLALAAAVFLTFQPTPVYAEAAGAAQTQAKEDGGKNNALSQEEVSVLLDFVKEKWDAGGFESEADILAAIGEGEEKFGVCLGDSEKEQLAAAVKKLDELGLDHDAAIAMAKKLYQEHGEEISDNLKALYDRYGDALVENAGRIIKEQLAGPVGEALKEELAEPLEKAVQEQIVEPAKEAALEAVETTAKNFWSDLKSSVVSFFRNIFS